VPRTHLRILPAGITRKFRQKMHGLKHCNFLKSIWSQS